MAIEMQILLDYLSQITIYDGDSHCNPIQMPQNCRFVYRSYTPHTSQLNMSSRVRCLRNGENHTERESMNS